MQQTELPLYSGPLCYGKKKPNTNAVQLSKLRGTQHTVNSNSGAEAPTTAKQKILRSDQRYGSDKIRTVYNYYTRNSTLLKGVLKCPSKQ
jgi:hypothetical protein